MNLEPPHSSHSSVASVFTFNASITDKSTGQTVRGIVSGLSLDGCLFQSPCSFSSGTILRLEFLLSGHRIQISAIVRQLSPAWSLRLEFFALDSAESFECLQDWLAANSLPPSLD